MNEREEFNEDLIKLKKSYDSCKVKDQFSFSEYCIIFYNKCQADNMFRIGE